MNMEDLIIDADSALRDVSTFRLELTEFDGIRGMLGEVEEHDRQFAEDLGEFSIRVEQLLERLERTLKEIEARQTSGSASAAAFYLSTLSNEFSAQIEWLQRTLEGIKRRIRGPVSSEGALYSLNALSANP